MRTFRLLATLASLVMLASCDDSSANGQTDGTRQPASAPRVALVIKTVDNPFFLEMEEGARRAAAENGVQLVVRSADDETSFGQQIAIVDDLIAQKVDAIVLAPSDSHKLVPVMKKARDAGIQLVNLDNRLDEAFQRSQGMQPIPVISVDNVKGAYLAARALAATTPGPVEAAVIEGVRNAANAQARKIGALKAFAERRDIEVVATEVADWKADEAAKATKEILAAHPDVKLLFCANDTMALGAIDFLRRQGIRGVMVSGFDAVAEARKAVAAGELVVSVDQQAAEQGYRGIKTALAEIRGETVPDETLVEVKLVTARGGRI